MTPPESTSALLARLDAKLDALNEKVEDISIKLYGNGRPGIIVDQVLQSTQISQLLDYAKKNDESIEKLKSNIPHKWLAKNWKTIGAVLIAGFLLLHSIAPADLSLWTWFSKLLGGG